MAHTYHIYSAESQIRHGGHVLRSMWRGLIDSRYMAYRLFRRDVRSEYAQSAFGMLWDFLDPLVLACIFYFLMSQRVINPGELAMPRAIFVIYGLLLYQTFIESALVTTGVLRRSRSLMAQQKVPPEAFLLACVYRVGFFSVFRVLIMLLFSLILMRSAQADGLMAFSAAGFGKFVLLFPLMILPGLALGTMLSPFNAIYNDVLRATRLVLMPMRYLSPVLWKIPWEWVDTVNPLAPFIRNLRLLATTNTLDDWGRMAGWSVFFLIFLLVGWLVFHLSVPVLADKS